MDYGKALEVADRGYSELELERENHTRVEWKKKVGKLRGMTPPRKLGQARVLLAAAIIAKAVDSSVDVGVINGGRDHYGARTMADMVVAKFRHRVDIGSRSKNPLNGNTFVSASVAVVDDIMVGSPHQSRWDLVVELLDELSVLDEDEAFQAWKGYLDASVREELIPFEGNDEIQLHLLSHWLSKYITENSEGGVAGQVLVGACLEVAYSSEQVSVGMINDPDRSRSGDVVVSDESGNEIVVVEVKQKEVSFEEVVDACQKLDSSNLRHFVYCAFSGLLGSPRAFELGSAILIFECVSDFISHSFVLSSLGEKAFCECLMSCLGRLFDAQGHAKYFHSLSCFLAEHGMSQSLPASS